MSARGRFATGLGVSAAATAYLVLTTTKLGLVYYLPTHHAWTFTPPTGVIAMDWFARSNATLAVALLTTWLGWRLAPGDPKTAARWAARLWPMAALMTAWSAGYTALWLCSRL